MHRFPMVGVGTPGSQFRELGEHIVALLAKAVAHAQRCGSRPMIAHGDDAVRISSGDPDEVRQNVADRTGIEDQVGSAARDGADAINHAVAVGRDLGPHLPEVVRERLPRCGDNLRATQARHLDGGVTVGMVFGAPTVDVT